MFVSMYCNTCKSVTVLGDINLKIIFFPFIIVIIYEIPKLFIFLVFFTDLQLDTLAGSWPIIQQRE